jgi:hypothetical protein
MLASSIKAYRIIVAPPVGRMQSWPGVHRAESLRIADNQAEFMIALRGCLGLTGTAA